MAFLTRRGRLPTEYTRKKRHYTIAGTAGTWQIFFAAGRVSHNRTKGQTFYVAFVQSDPFSRH